SPPVLTQVVTWPALSSARISGPAIAASSSTSSNEDIRSPFPCWTRESKPMATRLRSRMVRSVLALVLAVVVIAGLTSGILFAKEVRADARLRLTGRAETLIISLTDRAIERGELTAADVERLAPPGTEVVLRDATGAVVARTGPVLADKVMSVDVRGPGDLSATVSPDRAPVDDRVRHAWNVIAALGAAVA